MAGTVLRFSIVTVTIAPARVVHAGLWARQRTTSAPLLSPQPSRRRWDTRIACPRRALPPGRALRPRSDARRSVSPRRGRGNRRRRRPARSEGPLPKCAPTALRARFAAPRTRWRPAAFRSRVEATLAGPPFRLASVAMPPAPRPHSDSSRRVPARRESVPARARRQPRSE